MFTFIAVLMFVGAFVAAASAIYATIAASLPKIEAALAGNGGISAIPALPSRQVPLERFTVRPVAGRSMKWRVAA